MCLYIDGFPFFLMIFHIFFSFVSHSFNSCSRVNRVCFPGSNSMQHWKRTFDMTGHSAAPLLHCSVHTWQTKHYTGKGTRLGDEQDSGSRYYSMILFFFLIFKWQIYDSKLSSTSVLFTYWNFILNYKNVLRLTKCALPRQLYWLTFKH